MRTPRFFINTNRTPEHILTLNEEAPATVATVNSLAVGDGRSAFHRLLNANGDIRALRTNDLLRKDEWKQLDDALLEIAKIRVRPLEILKGYGLTKNIDGIGVLLSQYEKSSDMNNAEVSMSGVSSSAEDAQDVVITSVPIPIIMKDFRINVRRLMASRRGGEGIDVTQTRTAARKVSEKMCDMLFNGYSGKLDGSAIYGLTTDPNLNTVSGSTWQTVANIYTNIISGIQALQSDRMFGPYGIFVSNAEYLLMLTYIASVNQTALMRVLSIPGVKFVEPADQLTAQCVIVQLSADVVDLAIAQDITNVQWDEVGGLSLRFKVMAAYAPRTKSDYDTRSGIAVITGIS